MVLPVLEADSCQAAHVGPTGPFRRLTQATISPVASSTLLLLPLAV